MFTGRIIDWLRLEETKYIKNLDDNSAALLHAKIIQKKPFLNKLYKDFYNQLKKSISGDVNTQLLIELGSGGGFIKEIIPGVITSDIMKLPNVDKCFSALDMPFKDGTVNTFFMIDVFHHVNDANSFLKEINRCLKRKGKVIMIEPANTFWSRIIWENFHHENFDPDGKWSFEKDKPLSSANSALPWIVFCRDRERFKREFPSLKIVSLNMHTPFRYLISGGLSVKQLLPTFTYALLKIFENILKPFNNYLGMFMTIEIEKI